MYQKFIQALTWNSLTIFLYKSILLMHQIVLFHFVSKELYGTSGTLFASIYLLIGITGFGFDYTLFSFFSTYKQSKKQFKELLPQYIARFWIVLLIALCLYILLQGNYHNSLINFFTRHITPSLLPYMLLIFISESMKKSLESLAQLSFLNKQIAVIQVSTIIAYVCLVWSGYAMTGIITLHTIFIPMVITSYAELFLLIGIVHSFYRQLPSTTNHKSITRSERTKEKIYNYINQTTKNLFSPNFLMVFIAYNLGMYQAGYIRFFTNIITLLYMLLNRSIGVPSGALFSHIQQSFKETRTLFLKITNAYIQLLYILIITIGVVIIPHITYQTITPHVILFIATGFVEYITLTYEKLFIVQKSAKLLAYTNMASIICLGIALLSKHPFLGSSLILLPIFIIRLCTAGIIGHIAYKKWDIMPRFAIKPKTLIVSCFFAGFSYVLIKLFYGSLS